MINLFGCLLLCFMEESTNFAIQKSRVEDILYCKDLYESLKFEKKPTTTSEWDQKKMNRKTIGPIRLCIKACFIIFRKRLTQIAYGQHLSLCMRKRMYKNKTFLILTLWIWSTKTMKLNLDNEIQALLLLSSLPNNCEKLVVSLSNSAPEKKIDRQV